MPRPSGSGKRQSGGAVQRDARHENGHASSGKRSGRKSHGSAHGNKADHASSANGAALSKSNADADAAGISTNLVRRHSLDGISETSSSDLSSTQHALAANGSVDGGHLQIDVSSLKNNEVHRDSGPLSIASTVLRRVPMQDTLAFLIILMHLPSLALSIAYCAFTCLTFVPPVTTSSGMNINIAELFESSTTAPSIVTVWFMDLFFLLVWAFLWEPLQDAVLDLAKPIIAITLGGGAASRNGSPRGLFTCFLWVITHHVIRGTRAYWTRLVPHIPPTWLVALNFGKDIPLSGPYPAERDSNFWLQSGLAIHILTQGTIRYIRDWYLRREKANAANAIENDTSKHSAASITNEAANENGHASNAHHDADGAVVPATTAVSAATTAKKKRKQSAQVRLQQPLWAALGSTKIVVVKEYELSESVSDSLNANAVDIQNLGNAPFDRTAGRVWISHVSSDEVSFSSSHFPKNNSYIMLATAAGETDPEKLRPFFARVNNAPWPLTRIQPIESIDNNISLRTRWTGAIYGLLPCSRYNIEFVDSRTNLVLFATSVRTVKESIRPKDGSAPALPEPPVVVREQQPLEPDSPVVTLQASIETAQHRLGDEKNKLKTLRKDIKGKANAGKKEVDGQAPSASHADEKLKAKIRQQETTKAHQEREAKDLASQLKNFDAEPELGDRKKKAERLFGSDKKQFDSAQKNFNTHKTKLDNEIKGRELEQTNLNSKRNKIATRIAKVDSEIVNLSDANARGLNEAERRTQERATFVSNNAAIEKNYSERIAGVSATNASKQVDLRALVTQVEAARNFMANGAKGMPAAEAHGYPSWNTATAASYAASYWQQQRDSASDTLAGISSSAARLSWNAAQHLQPPAHSSRGRSSSMLSAGSRGSRSSGDSMDAPFYPAQPRVQALYHDARGSGSSGSGSAGPESPI